VRWTWFLRENDARPGTIDLVVTDFDGVMATTASGRMRTARDRGCIKRQHAYSELWRRIDVVILSSEPNPVVRARAAKMGDVEAVHGIDIRGKGAAFRELLARKRVDAAFVAYIGNDLNDLPCFALAGWSVAVADAYPEVVQQADYVLQKAGGHGALREVCDMILTRLRNQDASDRETQP
jgi:N-acylneuraminate cytidylyltransferase